MTAVASVPAPAAADALRWERRGAESASPESSAPERSHSAPPPEPPRKGGGRSRRRWIAGGGLALVLGSALLVKCVPWGGPLVADGFNLVNGTSCGRPRKGVTARIVDEFDEPLPAGSVGDYVNAFERLRDPSHLRAWTMEEWRSALDRADLQTTHEEQIYKTMEFKSWAARYDTIMQALLRAMLTEIAPEVKATLQPQGTGAELTFRLCEGLFISKRA